MTRSQLPCRRALAQLGLPGNTYYCWLQRQTEGTLEDRKGGSSIPWNKISPEEEISVLAEARASPGLSCRELAFKITDCEHTYISESTVYGILKREGLIKPAEIIGFKAAKEYRRKTKLPNELWASDCCYLRVIDWGWYYLVTVMDDFSRFILNWGLKIDMTGGSLEDGMQQGDTQLFGKQEKSYHEWLIAPFSQLLRHFNSLAPLTGLHGPQIYFTFFINSSRTLATRSS